MASTYGRNNVRAVNVVYDTTAVEPLVKRWGPELSFWEGRVGGGLRAAWCRGAVNVVYNTTRVEPLVKRCVGARGKAWGAQRWRDAAPWPRLAPLPLAPAPAGSHLAPNTHNPQYQGTRPPSVRWRTSSMTTSASCGAAWSSPPAAGRRWARGRCGRGPEGTLGGGQDAGNCSESGGAGGRRGRRAPHPSRPLSPHLCLTSVPTPDPRPPPHPPPSPQVTIIPAMAPAWAKEVYGGGVAPLKVDALEYLPQARGAFGRGGGAARCA
jgi:hypothetical protein